MDGIVAFQDAGDGGCPGSAPETADHCVTAADPDTKDVDSQVTADSKGLEDIVFDGVAGALGISIKGGTDQPFLMSKKKKDPGIFVVHIYDGGIAAVDGRLRLGDRILSVNGRSVEAVKQIEFLTILMASGTSQKQLTIRVKHHEVLQKRLESHKVKVPVVPPKPTHVESEGASGDCVVTMLTGDLGCRFEPMEACFNADFSRLPQMNQEVVLESLPSHPEEAEVGLHHEGDRQPLEVDRQPLEVDRQPLEVDRQPAEVDRQHFEVPVDVKGEKGARSWRDCIPLSSKGMWAIGLGVSSVLVASYWLNDSKAPSQSKGSKAIEPRQQRNPRPLRPTQ